MADEHTRALIAATAVLLDQCTRNLHIAQQHLRKIVESLPEACPACGGRWTRSTQPGMAGAMSVLGASCLNPWHVEHFPQGTAATPRRNWDG